MHNDYLFRALLQENNEVLKELIQNLLYLPDGAIKSAIITNPIMLGDSIDSKEFLLDINVKIDNGSVINIELQVINQHNWVERSLSYLCRNFDKLNHSEDFAQAKGSYQIGLLNFTLFKDHPSFFSTYKMMDVKDHYIYSDKLHLSVLDLTQIDNATAEDTANGLVYWAKLFSATSWEEIHMLAKEKPIVEQAANTVYSLTEEEKIRLQCEAREDFYKSQNDFHNYYKNKLAEKDNELAEKDTELAEKDRIIQELQKALEDKNK
ncbi:conserved hypothetical protein (putative transposase or invertase) [Pseudobutyrivibrio sp. YE44]|uniref:Rpn family recombination-promoting nuclease/putative transposase n=1 Tax=Pseudobutyrivibrio sp. YE44 TaxID=1520802 RepID=UPI000886A5AC|nr:Rpn family recombination-promoting nuclease/putative transposase [Pseudobutyrivibrio sp. YE44]SDB07502.1 conserved hypothetical protein (putative transposase or invertase) [Pseudobutyrivibrio sp. YE44]